MPFEAKDMHRIYSGRNDVYLYHTAETKTQVNAANYWNAYAANLKRGDVILVVILMTGTPSMLIRVVTSSDFAATVTTATADSTA